jgi:hypothetical protein
MTWKEKFCPHCGQPLSDVIEREKRLALVEAQTRSCAATNAWVQEDEDCRFQAAKREATP